MICGVEMPLDAQLSDATSHLSSNALHLFFFTANIYIKASLNLFLHIHLRGTDAVVCEYLHVFNFVILGHSKTSVSTRVRRQ